VRAHALAGLLLLASALVVVGVVQLSQAAAWIVGGLLLAGWALLTFAEVRG
jgi:hypothetical protein